MHKLKIAALAVLVALPAAAPMSPARADNGQIAAGVAGGLLGGMLLGGALAQRPRYYEPAPVYVEPPPAYVVEPRCYWTRGEPYWDDYRGIWRRPRVRVCD